MERQITVNNFKTRLLFSVLIILFLAISSMVIYLTGDYAWGIFSFLIGLAYIFWTYKSALKQVIKLNHAELATRKSYRRLYLTVENLSITLGISTPKIYVINDPALNAFAAGHNVNESVIGVTSGLLENLNRQELEGVIAHELSHIVNRDVKVSMMAFALVAGLAMVLYINFRFGGGRSRRNNNSALVFLIILGVGVVLFVLAYFAKMAISRQREYLADVTGAQITRYPLGLAAALDKIGRHGSKLRHTSNSTAHFFLADPVKKSFLTRLLSTHPPLEDRVVKLRQLEEEGY